MRRYFGIEVPPGRWVQRRFKNQQGSRQYDVYLPAGLSPRSRVPLVLLLHGCRQSSMDFARQTGFTAAADAAGFIVLAPRQEIQHQLQRCWRWYDSAHQRRGAGEPAILTGIVEEVSAETVDWRIDRRRVYTAGLSAGGAMALILATTYPDVFAAAGVHSATAYRSATHGGLTALGAMAARSDLPSHGGIGAEMAPVVLIHGTDDRVVRPPNADRIVDQWLASRTASRPQGLNKVRPLATTRAFVVDHRRCIRTRWYTARGRRVLEYWRIDGLGHAWSGGRLRGAFIDKSGPKSADVMWTFFHRHRLSNGSVDPADLLADHDLSWDPDFRQVLKN
jgi:poly(hydroxyalkanoate) depolymerase family esterase